MARGVVVGIMVVCFGLSSASSVFAQTPVPAYLIVGDSIEFGLGDDVAADGFGYPPVVAGLLATFFGSAPVVANAAEPFAQARDIWRAQVPRVLAAVDSGAPVVVSWGGGGNDLAEVATGRQAAACRQQPSCLGRFNALLNEVEQTIDRTIGTLRRALGPDATILMRTQYNALLRPGCAAPEVAALGNITLEGAPGTLLDRGLNDRIRSVAQTHGAQVVDIFLPFAASAATLVSTDCVHPSGAGYQAIAAASWVAFLAAQ